MDYGVKSSANCDARDQPATVSEKDCMHTAMAGWAKQLCDSKEHCLLPKLNEKMFVCDYSPDNFLQVTYRCNKITDVDTAIICEGESAAIQCEEGALHIMSSNFGRLDANTCSETPSKKTFCTSAVAHQRVKALCNGKEECNLTASAEHLGEPTFCDDNPLYLSVDYICY
ncbi:rhamnose-binding lectin-like [Seriola aureovittata]|nr:rhamnose-binding lectin-like [Seriola aureovittata]